MKSLLPSDKLELKRLNNLIGRISQSGILLVGVNTKKLSTEFTNYLISTHKLKQLKINDKILSHIANDETLDKNNFFYDKKNTCYSENFNDLRYTYSGISVDKNLCKKKEWANNCSLKWDGITNNNEICKIKD